MTADTTTSTLKSILTGPARYQADTPWQALPALAATVVIVALPLLLLPLIGFGLSAFGIIGHTGDAAMRDALRLNTPTGVAVLGGSQLVSLALVWWFAGRGGRRLETLSLASGWPSYAKCLMIALVFLVIMAVIEFVLYHLIKFDVFRDSRFLVEGLRSVWWPVVLVLAVVLAPLWEELTFRGFLLSALAKTRLGIVGGGLVSNTLWAGLHAGYSLPALIGVFTAGLVITWLVWKTGSIRVAIVTHAAVNASAAAFAGIFSPYISMF